MCAISTPASTLKSPRAHRPLGLLAASLALLAVLLAAGCSSGSPTLGPLGTPIATPTPTVAAKQWSLPPAMEIDPNKFYTATVSTDKGDITVALFAKESPQTVNSFVFLARQGFFDNVTFHRIIPGFVAQGGDPTGTGRGGPGYRFSDEFNLRPMEGGALAMANAGPGTNGSQFFITYAPQPFLDGRHTVFGKVTSGMDVAQQFGARDPSGGQVLPPGPRMKSVTVEERAELADPSQVPPRAEPVVLQAKDGVQVSGSWRVPEGASGPVPAVVLLHNFGENRYVWNSIANRLLDQGYGVLAFDARGHGGSTRQKDASGNLVAYQPTQVDDPFLNSMVNDVRVAAEWLQARSDVDRQRIGVMGSIYGANIAYVAKGAIPAIKTVVAVSPISNVPDALKGKNVPDFKASNILFLAGTVREPDAKTFADESGDPKDLRPFPQSSDEGTALLGNNPDAMNAVLDWLNGHLKQ